MFGSQAVRLLSQKWKTATLLAEELFTMFQDDIPLSQNAPVTIHSDAPGVPALTISTNGNGDTPVLRIIGPGGQDGTISVGDGGITFTTNNNTTNVTQNNIKTNPTAFFGTVLSGTGSSYQVSLLPDNKVVLVTQGQILNTEQIPAGTPVVVIKAGSSYFMQVPVWLA